MTVVRKPSPKMFVKIVAPNWKPAKKPQIGRRITKKR